MMKKSILVAALCVFSLFQSELLASARYWTNAAGDRIWTNPLNWLDSFGSGVKTVPVYPDDAGIYGGVLSPILGGTVPDVGTLYVGVYGAGTGTLNVADGDAFTLSYLWVGGNSSPGIVNLSGGRLNPGVQIWVGGVAGTGSGTFNMTGGRLVTPTFSIGLGSAGIFHLDGGIAEITTLAIGSVSGSKLDITNGVLIMPGDTTATITSYISGGKITAYSGTGVVRASYDGTNTTVTAARTTAVAYRPSPAISAKITSYDFSITDLKWLAGNGAVNHDVYLGTDSAVVNNATISDLTGIYRGRQAALSYYPLTLAPDTTYYWRIDEVASGGGITKGDVWTFGTGKAVRDLYADTWVATDAIGRTLGDYGQCGQARNNKLVGIFYLIWHRYSAPGPFNVTEIIAANPFTYPTNPWYDNPDFGAQFGQWWAEPEAGYFISTDKWYIRRNMSMLANAGVDVLFIDATNAIVYWPETYALCEVMEEMRLKGDPTPKICVFTHGASPQTVTELYSKFYSRGHYKGLWFYWNGKPLMLGYPDGIVEDDPRISVSTEVRNFFNWRTCWAWASGLDEWSWLNLYPQGFGYHTAADKPESVPVTIASHPTNNIGRSNTGIGTTPQPAYNEYHLTVGGTQGQGIYFDKEWGRALAFDPNMIYITGWNEWTASWWNHNGSPTFLGQSVPTNGYYFVDAYNQEYSRDAEPMKGGFTDNYYYQMADNIRKFKGVRPPLTTSGSTKILIDGSFSDWADVAPEFRDIIGDTIHRNSLGVGSAGPYINNTGRNDFVNVKVARDDSYVYFYAETNAAITPYTDPNWMLLFIDADQNKATGWEGYDFLVNYGVIDSDTTTLKSTTSGWNWTMVNNNISYRVSGNKIEIAIPRSDIGEIGSDVKFDFHWADNIQKNNDVIEFAVSGDSAPDRRFNYRYDTSVGEKACDRIWAGGQGKAMDLDSDCDFDIDDVALLAAEWLNPYTFTNFADLASDWLKNYNSANLPAVTLLSDNFESGLSNWPSTGWDLVTTTYISPTHSLECGGSGTADGDLISKDLDTHGKTSLRIAFKYKMNQYIDDSDDAILWLYNGSGYDTIVELGKVVSADKKTDVWLTYTITLYNSGTNAKYFKNNFKIKIQGNGITSSERFWIDDVSVMAAE